MVVKVKMFYCFSIKCFSTSLVSALFEYRLLIESQAAPPVVSAVTPLQGSTVAFSLCNGTCQ